MGELKALPITECLICHKPLGADSRDSDYRLCHEHRKCSDCGSDLHWKEIHSLLADLTESELELTPERVQHARCGLLTTPTSSEDPSVVVKQSYLDRLNQARLLILPNDQLSIDSNEKQADLLCAPFVASMTLDQQIVFLKRLESCVAHVSIALKKDRNRIKEVLNERENKRAAKAKLEARTSSRPVSTPASDVSEMILAAFMENNAISSRVVAQKILRDRNKAIQGLVAVGLSSEAATSTIDSQLRKEGILK